MSASLAQLSLPFVHSEELTVWDLDYGHVLASWVSILLLIFSSLYRVYSAFVKMYSGRYFVCCNFGLCGPTCVHGPILRYILQLQPEPLLRIIVLPHYLGRTDVVS